MTTEEIEAMRDAWEHLVDVIKALAKNIQEFFEEAEESEREKVKFNACNYRVLLRRGGKSSDVHYNYMPIMRRNLPYQRRNYRRKLLI